MISCCWKNQTWLALNWGRINWQMDHLFKIRLKKEDICSSVAHVHNICLCFVELEGLLWGSKCHKHLWPLTGKCTLTSFWEMCFSYGSLRGCLWLEKLSEGVAMHNQTGSQKEWSQILHGLKQKLHTWVKTYLCCYDFAVLQLWKIRVLWTKS